MTGPYEAITIFGTLALGFLMLDLCLSELIGIVPFAGGNYGFVRCSLGPFWGYLAACLEFAYYNFYNARAIGKISILVATVYETEQDLEPLWAALGLAVVVILNLKGGNVFWTSMMAITLYTLVLLCIFFVGAYSHVDFKKYALGHYLPPANRNDGSRGNYVTYMRNMGTPNAFFIGLDMLPLASQRVLNEVKVVPRVLIVGWSVMFVLSTLTFFAVMCHYPGASSKLKSTTFVLQYGLADAITLDPHQYPLLLLAPTVATSIGFMFGAGNQLAAMSESGLMPKFLRVRHGIDSIPVVALLCCAAIQYLIYVLIHHYEPLIPSFASAVVNLASSGLFVLLCVAFIVFRHKFASMKRNFVNPLGVPGAVLGVLYWGFFFVIRSDHRFQTNRKGTKTFYIFMSIMLVYYFVYVQYVQFFSAEEQEKFMKVYVLTANQRRQQSVVFKYVNYVMQATGLTKLLSWAASFTGANSSQRRVESLGSPSASMRSRSRAGTGVLSKRSRILGPDRVVPISMVADDLASSIKSDRVQPPSTAARVGQAMEAPLAANECGMADDMTVGDSSVESHRRLGGSALRAVLQNGSVEVDWSGQLLPEASSRRLFEMILMEVNGTAEQQAADTTVGLPLPAEELLDQFPQHFAPVIMDHVSVDMGAPVSQTMATSCQRADVDVQMTPLAPLAHEEMV